MKPGPRNLITDIAGLRVGNAQDDRLKTGTTVLIGDDPLIASYAVMGGAPGTRDTDLLEPDKTVPGVDALVLSGGSAFGLAAAQGVMDALAEAGRGFPVGPARVPIVPAAIIFDLVNGGDTWDTNPYPDLGRTALAAARAGFEIGTAGAGTGALTGHHKGGLGSASLVLDSGHTVGALVVVNPLGDVLTPNGQHFWAAPFEIGTEFGGLGPDRTPGLHPLRPSTKAGLIAEAGSNTTIAIIATDAPLTKAEAKRLTTAAHDGMARAIVPSHTPHDGDLIFAATTSAGPPLDPISGMSMLCHAGAVCLTRAIARAAWEATPEKGDWLPTVRSQIT